VRDLGGAPTRDGDVFRQIAATLIPKRASRGLPYDLARVEPGKRRALPGKVIYGTFARVLANMDGNKTLLDLVREAECESRSRLSSSQVKDFVGAVEFLTEHGYLATRHSRSIGKEDVKEALRQAGLAEGDLVFLHSRLSGFGHVSGGVETCIDAFLEVLGPRGTLLMPTFTNCCFYYDGHYVRSKRYRPFHPEKCPVWVGRIPEAFLKRPGVIRSAHPTHSVAGVGPLAGQCLLQHRQTDPPTCRRSPFGKLVDLGGKMVWFGVGLAATTFFHFLEDELDMPYLRPGLCGIEGEDGEVRTVRVPKHLPGHREFYRNPGEETKMYRRLIADGLVIRKAELGFGEVKAIDARQMYELGVRALRDDPNLLLCDDPDCLFCSRNRV